VESFPGIIFLFWPLLERVLAGKLLTGKLTQPENFEPLKNFGYFELIY
jgi:hypothetical protein